MRRFCSSCSFASCLRDLFTLILSGLESPLRPALVELVEVKLVPKCTVTRLDSPIMVRTEEKAKGRTWRLRSEVVTVNVGFRKETLWCVTL